LVNSDAEARTVRVVASIHNSSEDTTEPCQALTNRPESLGDKRCRLRFV